MIKVDAVEDNTKVFERSQKSNIYHIVSNGRVNPTALCGKRLRPSRIVDEYPTYCRICSELVTSLRKVINHA